MAATKYEALAELKGPQFRRLTGVKRPTFAKMLAILTEAERKKKEKGGRPSKLCVPDQLLMALEYMREYRTYFHIGLSYGVSESTAYKICRWVENTLISDGAFSLPGRKALTKSDMEYEVIMIDATESPIERPKKDSAASTPARRSGTR
jgi:hypothetical protein